MVSWATFIFGTLGWSIVLFLIKIFINALTPIDIVLYRLVMSFCVLVVLIKYFDINITNYKNLIKEGVVIGLFNLAIRGSAKKLSSLISSVFKKK